MIVPSEHLVRKARRLSVLYRQQQMVNLNSGLLGAVVFARHADRIESFSSPTTWATFNTFITPLGTVCPSLSPLSALCVLIGIRF
jgi:hypothetical protein